LQRLVDLLVSNGDGDVAVFVRLYVAEFLPYRLGVKLDVDVKIGGLQRGSQVPALFAGDGRRRTCQFPGLRRGRLRRFCSPGRNGHFGQIDAPRATGQRRQKQYAKKDKDSPRRPLFHR